MEQTFPFARRVAPDVSSWTRETTAPAQNTTAMRIVLIEWRIKKGEEEQFLEYWSKRVPVPDRSGLIGEFLSRVECQKQGGFKWSSQHGLCGLFGGTGPEPRPGFASPGSFAACC